VLAYIFPVYIFIYSIITGEIKLNLKSLLLILSSLTGVILISFHKFGKIDNLIGIFFAILSGLIYAVYIIINKDKKQNKNQIDIVFYQLIGASFLSIPYLFISEKNFNLNYNFIFNMLGISIIGTLSAIYFLIKGMEKIGAFKSSIISLTEPVFAVMISVLFLNEKITILQLYGLILIIISCIFSSSIK
jgi:drug/metabolite transporter (DMT)-like permease